MMTFVYILVAYLLGSIPAGLWIGQIFFNINLRDHGSGNTGTTNTFRILGKKAGSATFLIDMLKGTLAVLLPLWFGGDLLLPPLAIGFFAIIGHTLPLFAGFKGGKAVATSAGVLLGYAPVFLLFLLLVFVATLYLFSMISLSSVTVAVCGLVAIALFPAMDFILHAYDLLFSIIMVLIASIIIVRHKDNVTRIKNKQENLVPWGLNLSNQNPKK